MKSVLVLIHDDDGQETRLQCALDVARALDGRLRCLDAIQAPVIVGDYMTGADVNLAFDSERRRSEENRAEIEPRLRTEDVPYEWIHAGEGFEAALAQHAPLSDLIVLDSTPPSNWGPDPEMPARLALRARMPILTVPRGQTRFDPFRPAVVAWDGSPAADSAMRAALPLLALSRSVRVVSLQGKADPAEAARYLSDGGCTVDVTTVERVDGRVSARLLAEAHAAGAGYMVMGCYGHSRLLERLFGGTTHDLLREADIPLLLAH